MDPATAAHPNTGTVEMNNNFADAMDAANAAAVAEAHDVENQVTDEAMQEADDDNEDDEDGESQHYSEPSLYSDADEHAPAPADDVREQQTGDACAYGAPLNEVADMSDLAGLMSVKGLLV